MSVSGFIPNVVAKNNHEIISDGKHNNPFGKGRFCQDKVMFNKIFGCDISCRNKHLRNGIHASYIENLERTHNHLMRQRTSKYVRRLEQDKVPSDATNKIHDIHRLPLLSTDNSEVQMQILQTDKEKRRKLTHNKVEKKRMDFINDKIKELENLLPENAKRRSNKRKGLILKESVEYIKKLRKEHDVIQRLQNKIDDNYNEIEKLSKRLQQVELRMQISNHGYLCQKDRKMGYTEPYEENSLADSPFSKRDSYPSKSPTTISQVIGLDRLWQSNYQIL